jgi:hypothetical protein
VALLAVFLLAAGALVVLANPRHRAFYFGRAGAGATTLPAVSAAGPAPGARKPARPDPARATARPPTRDPAEGVRIPISDARPDRLPAPGIPRGWGLVQFAGEASAELVRDERRLALRLRSERASFALHRDLVVDLREHPVLSWSWKVMRLPAGGDVRDAARDDQAAQVYVVFPRWPAPRTSSDVIGYLWDARAPVGTTLTHPRAANVRIVVLQSGPARLDTWVHERRDVAADYRALFGRQPPRVGTVALMIDSNHTRSEAEALFGELGFGRPAGPVHTEMPTTMLR